MLRDIIEEAAVLIAIALFIATIFVWAAIISSHESHPLLKPINPLVEIMTIRIPIIMAPPFRGRGQGGFPPSGISPYPESTIAQTSARPTF
jgi:hypothetical protein